jgi:hypothetical protein
MAVTELATALAADCPPAKGAERAPDDAGPGTPRRPAAERGAATPASPVLAQGLRPAVPSDTETLLTCMCVYAGT